MRSFLLPLIVAGLALGADAPKDDAVKKEYARFEGRWKFASVTVEGITIPIEQFKNSRLIFKGDQWTMTGSPEPFGGTYQPRVERTPKEMDVQFTEGPDKGQTSKGIYEFDGDTLKLCVGLAGKSRPTTFASGPRSGHVLEVLHREKPDRLAGTWTCLSAMRDGKPVTEDAVKQLRLVLTDSRYTTYRGEQVLFEGDYKLDVATEPRHMDITGKGEDGMDRRAKGIYALDGNTLKLCYTMPGKARPKAFESKAESGASLTVWKRAKP